MADRILPHDDNSPTESGGKRFLSERLKREAASSRPAFSESLHERICRAIRDQHAPPAPLPAGRSTSRRAGWAMVAAAVAVAASVVLVVWRPRQTPEPQPGRVQPTASVPEAPNPLAELDNLPVLGDPTPEEFGLLVDATLTRQQWAYLDHDARVGAELLLEHLPWELAAPRDQGSP